MNFNYKIMYFKITFLIIIPNMLGAAIIMIYFRFLNLTTITHDLRGGDTSNKVFTYDFTPDIIITSIFFIIAFIIAGVKIYRINEYFKKYTTDKLSQEDLLNFKREFLNVPSFTIRGTIIIWLIISSTISFSMYMKGLSGTNLFYFFSVLFIIGGSLATVIEYYLFDNTFRKVIPEMFPDGDFSQVKNVRNFHINSRMLIAFWIGGILPVFMLIIFSYTYINLLKNGIAQPADMLKYNYSIIFIAVLSIFMTIISSFYFSRNIGNQLITLGQGMKKVENGDFSVTLKVDNKDEIGNVNSGFNKMVVGLKEREKIKDVFGKYVSSNVRDKILNDELVLGGEKTEASILFSDIRNFTSFSEKFSANDVINFLNTYFNEMIKPIFDNNGILDKFIGDAIMAVFGTPVKTENHAEDAIETALTMKANLFHFNELRKNFNKEQIQIGVGINSGEIIAGNIGSHERMEYTVIGDSVNIASRIEGLSKVYGVDIVVTEDTIDMLPDKNRYLFRDLDLVKVKGREEPILIYELMGRAV